MRIPIRTYGPASERHATNHDIWQTPARSKTAASPRNALAFAGLSLFTFLLYARPNDLWPEVFGAFPIIKIVVVATGLTYALSTFNSGKPFTIWPLELRMLVLIVMLGFLFMPFAISPQDTLDTFTDTFLKIVLIFVLIINLVTSHKRLRFLLGLMLICASALAVGAIRDFSSGQYTRGRIEGAVGGMFSNPNDLAAALALLMPLAVTLALSEKGLLRLSYAACAMLLGAAVLVTLSRGGFLGLMALGGVLLWRLQPRYAWVWSVTALLGIGIVTMMMGANNRLATILNPAADETGSAQQRQVILQRAALVAARHSLIGVGVGNFHHYSVRELKAHNAYLEVWAELGMAGLIAYLTIILKPLHRLRGLERSAASAQDDLSRQTYYLSVGLQATLAAYLVCSFFGSLQYQWFLYYPAAFAICLQRLRHSEVSKNTKAAVEAGLPGMIWTHSASGKLWPSEVSHAG